MPIPNFTRPYKKRNAGDSMVQHLVQETLISKIIEIEPSAELNLLIFINASMIGCGQKRMTLQGNNS